MSTHPQLEQGMSALTLDDSRPKHVDSEDVGTNSAEQGSSAATPEDTDPKLVDPRPWPSYEMIKNPQGSGSFHYAIPLRKNALQNYARSVWPGVRGDLIACGLYALAVLVDDMSMTLPGRVQIAAILPRHEELYAWLEGDPIHPILCLFKLSKKSFDNRMTAEKVEKIANALNAPPDWFEISWWI